MALVSAGSYDLNVFLHGGYEPGIVTMLYGGSGTGKTNFCLLAAVSQAKKGNKVLFIDTEGGFSVERITQLVGTDDVEQVLRHLLVLSPTTFREQQQAFIQLEKYLKQTISLLIVDGMTILYRLEREERDEELMRQVQRTLAGQMRQLVGIARTHALPVLVTNQVYRWDETVKLVGGDSMLYWSKCHLELTREGTTRKLCIRKHRFLPEKELAFEIVGSGIKKKGLF